jgi:hypothetical protein
MDNIKDELVEHNEGQKLFTKRRVMFAIALGGLIAGVIAWAILGGGES